VKTNVGVDVCSLVTVTDSSEAKIGSELKQSDTVVSSTSVVRGSIIRIRIRIRIKKIKK